MQASRPIWSQDSNLAIIAETGSERNSRMPIPSFMNRERFPDGKYVAEEHIDAVDNRQ